MESSHLIPSYPGSEEDILASLLDAVPPAPSHYFDLLSLTPPSPSGACLPLLLSDVNKRDRESGELEDEGFEDCIEEEESAALQRDSDPSLATTSIPLHTINTTGLDSFFPLEGGDHSNNDDVFMVTEKSLVDELFDLDQGVAMEASEIPIMTSYTPTIDNNLPDLTSSLYNSSSLPSTPPFFSLSPLSSLYNYPPPPPPLVPVHHGGGASPDLIMTSSANTVTGHMNNNDDLDYLCTLLQNPVPHEMISPPVQFKRDLISPHRTEHGLSDTLMSTQANDYTYIPPPPPSTHHNNTISLESINSLSLITTSNNNNSPLSPSWNNTTTYRHNSDRSSQSERRRSPSPSHPLPSPASSVNTDYPESEFSKELPSPDVPPSLASYNKTDIVDMPFYEFKKLVDSNSISERDKDEVKAIRKKGKNKMAAKNCRHRKLELLSSLQQDIDKLKGRKARLALKALSLQREIEGYKSRYTYSTRQSNTQQLSVTTKVH